MKINIPLLFLPLLLTGVISCTKAPRVLVVVGGHQYDTTEFFNVFQSMEEITFDSVYHPHALELLGSARVDDYDLLLFYDFIPPMPLVDSSVYVQLTSKGKPMIFLHHALGTFQEWDGYKNMVGGRYMMPDYHSDTTLHSDFKHDIDIHVAVLDKEHPVTKEMKDFTIHDEGYSNIQVNEEVYPLFGTSHPDCHHLLGWVNQFNESTCIYLMFGHDRLAYENESFQQVLQNSIHWLSGMKVK